MKGVREDIAEQEGIVAHFGDTDTLLHEAGKVTFQTANNFERSLRLVIRVD